ncbi:Hsp70 family protein [Bacillus sp. ISL-46]|nr:Hsp70 family protein [Bacillus sp. ISL-46]
MFIDPENSIASPKRYIGNQSKTYPIKGWKLTPVDVVKEILTKIRVEASKFLGEEAKDAVITIPAYFYGRTKKSNEGSRGIGGLQCITLTSRTDCSSDCLRIRQRKRFNDCCL